jgi:hypothetical protein
MRPPHSGRAETFRRDADEYAKCWRRLRFMHPALLALVLAAQPAQPVGWPTLHLHPAACSPTVTAAFDDLDDTLAALREDIEDLSPRVQRRLREELRAVMLARTVAEQAACGQALVIAPPQPSLPPPPLPPAPPPPPVLDAQSLAALEAALARESFEPGKLRVLDIGLRGVCVTPAHAQRLLQNFPFEAGKQKAFARIAPQLLDDGLTFTLLDAFTFDAEKQRAAELLRSTPTVDFCRR